jgi:hypothetical protein
MEKEMKDEERNIRRKDKIQKRIRTKPRNKE